MEEKICPLCGTSDKIVEIVREGKVNEEIDNPYRCEGCGCEFGKIYGFMYNAIKEVSLAVEKDGLCRKIVMEKNMVGAWIKEFEGPSFDNMEQISEDKIRRFNEYLYGEEGKLTEKGGEPLKGDTVLHVESNIEVPYFNDLVKTMEKFTCKKVFK